MGGKTYNNDKGLSILHLNVRSLRNKREELDDFIKRNSVDLFILSETWINRSIHSNISDIAGKIEIFVVVELDVI